MLMYSTCIFCNQSLGTNEAIEIFPVGRRISFDAAMGRLWVICRKCERWNLSPLEIRWEVIEECERLFRDTRLRVTTDNIGMAKLPEGLELVRLGKPMRDEFAAWRYGDQFGRRRRRSIAYTAAGASAVGLVIVGGAVIGVAVRRRLVRLFAGHPGGHERAHRLTAPPPGFRREDQGPAQAPGKIALRTDRRAGRVGAARPVRAWMEQRLQHGQR